MMRIKTITVSLHDKRAVPSEAGDGGLVEGAGDVAVKINKSTLLRQITLRRAPGMRRAMDKSWDT